MVTKGGFPGLGPYMQSYDLQAIGPFYLCFWLNHLQLQVKSAQLNLVYWKENFKSFLGFTSESVASAAATPWAAKALLLNTEDKITSKFSTI